MSAQVVSLNDYRPLSDLAARFLEGCRGTKPTGDGFVTCCTAAGHRDDEPSLSVTTGDDGQLLLNCFRGCSKEEIVAGRGWKMKDLFPPGSSNGSSSGSGSVQVGSEASPTLEHLARRTGLQTAFLASLGLQEHSWGVGVPYYLEDGSEAYAKRRVALSGKGKYRYPRGSKAMPYGLHRLDEARRIGAVVVVEGESDCWVLWSQGIPALGLPGASSARCLDPASLAGIDRIFVVREPDHGGAVFIEKVGEVLAGIQAEIYVVEMPGATKDPVELYVAAPQAFKTKFRAMCLASREIGEASIEEMFLSVGDLEFRQTSWFWHPYIPNGYLTILAGKPGVGKSYLTCALAGAVAMGLPLPGTETTTEPGTVLMWAGEDGPDDVIKGRLMSLGATDEQQNRVRVFDLEKNEFTFRDTSYALIEMAIDRLQPRLVIFDPFVSFAESGIDLHRQNEVRALLRPLIAIAAKTKVAMLVVAHVKKGTVEHALDSIMGSVDMGAAVRSALVAYQDPKDKTQKLMAHVKHNLTAPGATMKFGIDPEDGLYWNGTSDLSAEDLVAMSAERESRPAIEDARTFLIEELRDGPMTAKEIHRLARQLGIKTTTLHRAKHELDIKSVKQSMTGTWVWVFKNEGQSEVPF